jgi:NTP pyrophosphatase (non-canonical NTP hydrolase)
MSEIKKIVDALLDFRNERDWEQFHNPKDLAIALSIEASELTELYLWKRPEEADIEKVKDELADIFSFAFLISHKYGFDVEKIILDKIENNRQRYPVEKSKGNARKHSEM